jgi:hypothetical protein
MHYRTGPITQREVKLADRQPRIADSVLKDRQGRQRRIPCQISRSGAACPD